MAEILVQGISEATLARLEARARRNGRSVDEEARHIIECAAGADVEEVSRMLDRCRRRFEGKHFGVSSVDLIREDRQR